MWGAIFGELDGYLSSVWSPDSVSIARLRSSNGNHVVSGSGSKLMVVNNLALFDEGEPGTVTLEVGAWPSKGIDRGEPAHLHVPQTVVLGVNRF